MSWIPYTVQDDWIHGSSLLEAEKGTKFYAIRGVSLVEMRSIHHHIPLFGLQYVVIVLTSGLAFPPLYFHTGGVQQFLTALAKHAMLLGVTPVVVESLVMENDEHVEESLVYLKKFFVVARDSMAYVFGRGGLFSFECPIVEAYCIGDYDVLRSEESSSRSGSTSPHAVEEDIRALVLGQARPPPLGDEEFHTFLDGEGRVINPRALKNRIFHGGIDFELRPVVWKFLLGFFEYDSTYVERNMLVTSRLEEYTLLQAQWKTISPDQASRFSVFRQRVDQIQKDVGRTDSSIPFYYGDGNPNVNLLSDILVTHMFYNFDLGYCQGMCDLLSPILHVMEDESVAFWCFAALMKRMGRNFSVDGSGINSQFSALSKLVQLLDNPLYCYLEQNGYLEYHCCYRWILLCFKREFAYDDIRLWEILWSHYLCEHFHLYICVAILRRHCDQIMDEHREQSLFDKLFTLANELIGNIELVATLDDAECLCLFAGKKGAAYIPPETPLSLPANP